MPDDDISWSYDQGRKAGYREGYIRGLKEASETIKGLEEAVAFLRLSEPLKVAVQTENIQLKQKLEASEALVRELRAATSSAAQTTVTALDRIIEMEKVVTAAESWAKGGPHAALTDAVNHWVKLKKGWS